VTEAGFLGLPSVLNPQHEQAAARQANLLSPDRELSCHVEYRPDRLQEGVDAENTPIAASDR
jgi:hypothetical protein